MDFGVIVTLFVMFVARAQYHCYCEIDIKKEIFMVTAEQFNIILETLGSEYRVSPGEGIESAFVAALEAIPAYVNRQVEAKVAEALADKADG